MKSAAGTPTLRVRTRFQTVPDAPVSRIVLQLKGGRQGLLKNSENLCKGTRHAQAKMVGHNGKTDDQGPVVRVNARVAGDEPGVATDGLPSIA
jgi:hypothetical protein